MPALYSYVVRWDFGFAPNPFCGYCTLATCKPGIRATAEPGDWVVGTGSAGYGLEDHLVYAMVVAETLDFQSYWLDPRFRSKRPNLNGSLKQLYGDNIYHQNADGGWHQADSRHSRPDGIHEENMSQDLSANRVLISTEFYYWGGSAPPLPEAFRGSSGICKVGPGYRRNHPPGVAEAFLTWLRGEVRSAGVLGAPFEFRRHVPVSQLQLPFRPR